MGLWSRGGPGPVRPPHNAPPGLSRSNFGEKIAIAVHVYSYETQNLVLAYEYMPISFSTKPGRGINTITQSIETGAELTPSHRA